MGLGLRSTEGGVGVGRRVEELNKRLEVVLIVIGITEEVGTEVVVEGGGPVPVPAVGEERSCTCCTPGEAFRMIFCTTYKAHRLVYMKVESY